MKFGAYRYQFDGLLGYSGESRDIFLKKITGKDDIKFSYGGKEFFYRPLSEEGHIVGGLIASPRLTTYYPDKDLRPKDLDNFKKSFIVFNTNPEYKTDNDSQSIYLQNNYNIKVLKIFLLKISNDISVNTISSSKDFWAIVGLEESTELSITTHQPNLIDDTKDIEEIKQYRKHRVAMMTKTYTAKNGLDLSNLDDGDRKSIDNKLNGTGEITLKRGNKKIFQSNKNKLEEDIVLSKESSEDDLERAKEVMKKIYDKENN